jgi:hypothetical protein
MFGWLRKSWKEKGQFRNRLEFGFYRQESDRRQGCIYGIGRMYDAYISSDLDDGLNDEERCIVDWHIFRCDSCGGYWDALKKERDGGLVSVEDGD